MLALMCLFHWQFCFQSMFYIIFKAFSFSMKFSLFYLLLISEQIHFDGISHHVVMLLVHVVKATLLNYRIISAKIYFLKVNSRNIDVDVIDVVVVVSHFFLVFLFFFLWLWSEACNFIYKETGTGIFLWILWNI